MPAMNSSFVSYPKNVDGHQLMTLAFYSNPVLREAIRRNLVTFPAQTLSSSKRRRSDLQERIAQLYFVRGWSVRKLCDRYSLGPASIGRLLGDWRLRAIESGYIQAIADPDCLDELTPERDLAHRQLREQVEEKVFAARVAEPARSIPGAALFKAGPVADIFSEVRG
jgi:hypothetical protein